MNDTNEAACVVDISYLREITDNNAELFSEITRQYLDQAELILTEMEAAIDQGDQVQIAQLAHKLAGSSATCGMNAIVEPLQELANLQPYVSSKAVALLQNANLQLQEIRNALSQASPNSH